MQAIAEVKKLIAASEAAFAPQILCQVFALLEGQRVSIALDRFTRKVKPIRETHGDASFPFFWTRNVPL